MMTITLQVESKQPGVHVCCCPFARTDVLNGLSFQNFMSLLSISCGRFLWYFLVGMTHHALDCGNYEFLFWALQGMFRVITLLHSNSPSETYPLSWPQKDSAFAQTQRILSYRFALQVDGNEQKSGLQSYSLTWSFFVPLFSLSLGLNCFAPLNPSCDYQMNYQVNSRDRLAFL